MLPLRVVDVEGPGELVREDVAATQERFHAEETAAMPLYEFEPSSAEVLNALLPRYVASRINDALLQSAASELLAVSVPCTRPPTTPEELITTYTRLANAARQGEITQEITEIVSGADALAGK